MVLEDEALQDRTADRSEDEVMAIARELGLEFTSEELKEAAATRELTPGDLESVAGGAPHRKHAKGNSDYCPMNGDGHKWVKTGHYEDPWFGWLKEGGLFSLGYDTYTCSCCGATKKERK